MKLFWEFEPLLIHSKGLIEKLVRKMCKNIGMTCSIFPSVKSFTSVTKAIYCHLVCNDDIDLA